ncbi:hypothetical protein ACOSQ2_027881 [Xanthoceras sorbifolium]
MSGLIPQAETTLDTSLVPELVTDDGRSVIVHSDVSDKDLKENVTGDTTQDSRLVEKGKCNVMDVPSKGAGLHGVIDRENIGTVAIGGKDLNSLNLNQKATLLGFPAIRPSDESSHPVDLGSSSVRPYTKAGSEANGVSP